MAILVAQPDHRKAEIPEWVTDLDSFRKWATSDDFPNSGWYAHLDGNLWVDTNMELLWHNQVKGKIGSGLSFLVDEQDLGHYFYDRMLLTNETVGLSTEPDGMFVSHRAILDGRAALAKGDESKEVVGTPDMVLEVVSRTSRRKDRLILPDLYHRASIREYWIVENLADGPALELFTRGADGFVSVAKNDGWLASVVFAKEFRLTTVQRRSGLPSYRLEIR